MRKTKDLEDSVKNQTKLNFRAFSIGCSAALLAFACGSENNGGGDEPDPVGDPTAPVIEAPRAPTCDDNPLLAICAPPDQGGGDQGGGGVVDPPDAPEASPLDAAQAAAENILRANCGQCHGPALTPAQAEAGMNFIDDIDRLVSQPASGRFNGQALIKPLDSDASLIVERMRNGSMPPATSTGPRPSNADIATVAQFIDNPNFWDVPEARDCEGQIVDYDEVFELVQGDLIGEDQDDRPFLRYLSLTNRYNAGICADGDAMDLDRWAMSKMVNMLSNQTRIREPIAINADQTIYRIDIREYGWDRAVEVDGENFDDVWEAFIAIDPYAVPFVGDEADFVRDETETDVSILNADMLLDTAIIGNLYYAAIDVDIDQTLDEFELDVLGIDEEDNLEQELLIRAGTTQSILSRQDTLVQRQDIEVRNGAFWERFDFDANEQNESIFEDVFDFQEGGSQAIFTLPNNLLGYIIADADRNIVEESNILFDTLQNDFVVRTAVSCSGCHANGFLPVQDQVRDFVERNRRDFNADDFEAVQELYPSAQEFQRQVDDDTELYQRALTSAGVPTDTSDPVSDIFVRFDRDVNLETAAGDLGVPPADLLQDLNLLDPATRILRNGTLDRDDFTALYTASLCVMQIFSQNAPDLDVCDEAIDALDD